MGNTTREEFAEEEVAPKVISKTNWTSSQNTSCCSLTSATEPMPAGLDNLVGYFGSVLETTFPEAPLSTGSFALFVANEYKANAKHTICGHTDDQPWYASPPVFISLTYFPDGRPVHPDATFRFQIRDDSCNPPKWKNVFLDDGSICVMRADVMHRVLPPLNKYIKSGEARRRINLTFRNLVDPTLDPLGFQLAMANHYRYYGKPISIQIPSDVDEPTELIKRYRCLNPHFIVTKLTDSSQTRRKQHYKVKDTLASTYKIPFPSVMANKSNVVLETSQAALTF